MDDFLDELASEAAQVTRAPTAEESQKLTELGREVAEVDRRIERGEQLLSELKERRHTILHREMVDLMTQFGQDKIGLSEDNVDLVLEPFYHASLPKDDPQPGLDWLIENNHGDLIKATLVVTMDRRDFEHMAPMGEAIQAFAKEAGIEVKTERSLSVHWATLKSFVREQVEKGVALPLDILGATVGQVVKIKKRK
jgi:hypothetical protein